MLGWHKTLSSFQNVLLHVYNFNLHFKQLLQCLVMGWTSAQSSYANNNKLLQIPSVCFPPFVRRAFTLLPDDFSSSWGFLFLLLFSEEEKTKWIKLLGTNYRWDVQPLSWIPHTTRTDTQSCSAQTQNPFNDITLFDTET